MRSERASHSTSKSAPSKAPEVQSSDGNAPPSPATTIEIPFSGKAITTQRVSPRTKQTANADIGPALIFTHGAGGGISSPAMSDFAQGFATEADIVLFQGTMNFPSRVKSFHRVIEHFQGEGAPSALGGRSMGARAAVLSAQGAHETTKALVLASYPLVGQNGKVRDDILFEISENVDVLFISGDRDHMCKIDQLMETMTKMRAKTWLAIVEGADHGMSLKARAGVDAMRQYTGKVAAQWLLNARDASKTRRSLSWNPVDNQVDDSGWNWNNALGQETPTLKGPSVKQSAERLQGPDHEHPKRRRRNQEGEGEVEVEGEGSAAKKRRNRPR